jgi:multimeric flavodoxin WrbA
MQLVIFNGSPRGKNSNTKVLLDRFQKGFVGNGGEVVSYDYLIKEKHLDEQVEHFKNADCVFIALPLYVFSVPGIVKKFIEEIGNFDGSGKKIMFLVQSGFSEASHSDNAKMYFRTLAERWKMEYLGTIVKPGAEGIRMMPAMMTKKVFKQMTDFGKQLALTGELEGPALQRIATPYEFSKLRILFYRFLQLIGVANLYWNIYLKKNKVFDRRFDAPYSI